jgi:predicted  nucleic acid-binding Zn-ribbon protein
VAVAEVDESEVKQPTNNNLMKKTFVFVAAVLAAIQSSMPEANEEGKVALDEAQLDALEDALAQAKAKEEAKDQEIATLNEQLEAAQQEIEALKAEPAVHDDKVVETGDGQPLNEELSPAEQMAATIASAREMMK